jgi:phage terminase small subunit
MPAADAVTAEEIVANLRQLRDMCMGRVPVSMTTIVKNAREGTAEAIETRGLVFEPAGANRAIELLSRHVAPPAESVSDTVCGVLVAPGIVSLSDWEEKPGG